MSRALFRSKAIASQRPSPMGNVVLIQPLSFSLLTAFAVFTAIAILVFLHLIHYSKRTHVTGVLSPQKGIVKIQSPRTGIVIERKVKEGQFVQTGEVLFVLSVDTVSSNPQSPNEKINTSNAILKSINAINQNVNSEREKLQENTKRQESYFVGVSKNLQIELQKIDQEIALQVKKLESISEQHERYIKLEGQGYFSPLAIQQKSNDLIDQQVRIEGIKRTRLSLLREISSAENELVLLRQKYEKDRSQYDRQLLELNQSSLTTQSTHQIIITAPQSGTIAGIMLDPGQTVSNQTMLTILPKNVELEAHLYVPSTAIGFTNIGDKVALRISAYPYTKFGKIPGKVIEISQTTIATQEAGSQFDRLKPPSSNNSDSMYRVKIQLEKQTIYAYGKHKALLTGMELDAEITQETRTLLEWLLEPLSSFKNAL